MQAAAEHTIQQPFISCLGALHKHVEGVHYHKKCRIICFGVCVYMMPLTERSTTLLENSRISSLRPVWHHHVC